MEKVLRDKLPNGRFSDTNPTHSKIMKGVRGKGNKTTEMRLRAALASAGIRGWSMNVKYMIGKPDFYFKDLNIAIFVDGCFWHGCPRCGHIPRKNSAFWREKITRNRKRDKLTSKRLRHQGTRVLRFWEHDISTRLPRCIAKVKLQLDELSLKS